MTLSDHPMIVCGMYRSGTSITANAIAKLGVFMGEESSFYPSDSYNESGYFEHREITKLSRKILASLSMTYHRLWPVPEDWREWPRAEALLKEIDRLFSKEFASAKRWGWKDPMASVVLPFYIECLRRREIRPHVVICVRNPLEVEPSMGGVFSQEPISGYLAYGLWLHYTLSALLESKGQDRTVVMYDELLSNPRGALSPISESSDLSPSEAEWAEAVGVVRPDLCHRRAGSEALSGLPEIFPQTFELCRQAAGDPVAFRRGDFDGRIELLSAQLNQMKEMGGERSLPYCRFSAQWSGGAGRQESAESRYLPTRSWQRIELILNPTPRAEVLLSVFQLPGVVWIRGCKWKQDGESKIAKPYSGNHGTLELESGFHRLYVYGMHADQLRLVAPEQEGPLTLELDILVQTDYFIAIELVRNLEAKVIAAARRTQDLEDQCIVLERRAKA